MECSAIPAKVIAACFAIVAFVAAVAIGAAAGNAVETVLYRAMIVLLVCWPIGWAVGMLAQKVNELSIQAYKQKNPIQSDLPQEPAATDLPPASAGDVPIQR